MRQYWINFNGEQHGPLSIEQLAQMGLDDTAYVWHSGLPDWVKITKVPELNDILTRNVEQPDMPAEAAPELPQQEADSFMPEMPQQQEVEEHAMEMPLHQEPPTMPLQQAPPAMPQEPAPECPPTNLVWAIITTVLCCTPAGILGIVFAFLTKKRYREGDYAKAQRMSDYGAWSIIFSIILGLMSMPLSCASQLMNM